MAKMTLDGFVEQLKAVFGDELRAVVVYGSAAAGDLPGTATNQDLLVMVDRLDVRKLEGAAAAVRGWLEAGNPPPFILTSEEWRRSADVFPMEYVDILERHRVVHGDAPFASTSVDPADLRLELEHQAMGAVLHLRKGVLAAEGDGKRRLELLVASKGTVLAIFRAALRLHGDTPSGNSAEVCRQVASIAGFDPAPFERVIAHVNGSAQLSPKETAPVLAAYISAVEELVRHLDEFEQHQK